MSRSIQGRGSDMLRLVGISEEILFTGAFGALISTIVSAHEAGVMAGGGEPTNRLASHGT